ncbi:ribonuclease toxin immunity protein CdiI [Proteus mirabilis]|uniref:ribonuclease toxin immunity protein CdiI n=1 Tax=Proteus mirabilis TaxID=584 RepID=UPI00162A1C7E|nr:ribonuclease toxin immunity protein CdiI [Proteus mirabilis]MBJ5782598.1 ribonuclease toxin immunity protein CdiI [Salmonella enterica subsp. enterica serovar Derby]EHZ8016118.1 ribonuclease toxin immunity protein CdiI [Proteus mirabilis]EKV2711255.1 ribonuclease toxin immunity protein CdiI [Proteus mirabilis]EKX5073451.1 ribonuclease toxin immunity protein CdiI [Proteus mirabilis]ELB2725159.1 ribonuclease toxin immunity protein CdiI [Proteus mirabilis]
MIKELFNQHDIDKGVNVIVASYFDRMYEDGDFLRAIELLSQGGALNTDGAYCHFPDMSSYDESEHFDGVEFAVGYPPTEEDTVIVSKETCYRYVKMACERYLKIHPEDQASVSNLLSKMPV